MPVKHQSKPRRKPAVTAKPALAQQSSFAPAATRPFQYQDNQLTVGTLSLASLARKYGTPLYVYSADQITERLALYQQSFAGQDTLVCYAVKANSALALLKILADKGAGFDIVSGGELERVLRAAPEAASRVVFSGVGKSAAEIDLALEHSILTFNVESEGELKLLAARAARKKVRARFSLRINPDVNAETHPYISTGLREHKFGIEISKARAFYLSAAKSKWLEPYGVSLHIGSQIRSAAPFAEAVERGLRLIDKLKSDGIELKAIDAGGGLGIDYHEAVTGQSQNPAALLAEYSAAIEKALNTRNLKLLLEPGRFLVAQAGTLLSRVEFVKKNGKKTFVVTDAGMNDLIRPSLYQAHHEIVPLKPRKGRTKIVDVVGPVCESGDFFARDRALAPVEPGDLVALLDAGAYGLSLSSNYNTRVRPAEVLVEGKKARLIRRRETIADLLAPEIL